MYVSLIIMPSMAMSWRLMSLWFTLEISSTLYMLKLIKLSASFVK